MKLKGTLLVSFIKPLHFFFRPEVLEWRFWQIIFLTLEFYKGQKKWMDTQCAFIIPFGSEGNTRTSWVLRALLGVEDQRRI